MMRKISASTVLGAGVLIGAVVALPTPSQAMLQNFWD
jgi:hypothetical protein